MSSEIIDPLEAPMPRTMRLTDEPMIVPTETGFAVRVPAALEKRFGRAFRKAYWDRDLRLFRLSDPALRPEVEKWLSVPRRAKAAGRRPVLKLV